METEVLVSVLNAIAGEYLQPDGEIAVDSIGAIKILVEIETRLGIEFSDGDLALDEFGSMDRLTELVLSRMRQQKGVHPNSIAEEN